MSEQTFRAALRTLIFRWSATVHPDELIRELEAEIRILSELRFHQAVRTLRDATPES